MKIDAKIQWCSSKRSLKPHFHIDLQSFYKIVWLGWWLIVWCVPVGNKWYEVEEFSVEFMPS